MPRNSTRRRPPTPAPRRPAPGSGGAPAVSPAPPEQPAAGGGPLAGEALGVVQVHHLGAVLTVHPGLVDQARYLWELRVLADDTMPHVRRVQAAQELLVLLFGAPALDRLVQQHGGQLLSLDGAVELISKVTQAVHGAGPGESPAS